MLFTRRELLQKGCLLAAATIGARSPAPSQIQVPSEPSLNPNLLARFVDRLPIPSKAQSIGTRPDPVTRGHLVTYYRVEMVEFESKLHRDLKPTRQWGYGGSVPGPTFETRSGQGLFVEWVNRLPRRHFLPVDHHLHGAETGVPEVRTVVHLHGAKAAPENDGFPETWFVAGESSLYHYPNQQDPAMLWYHDHAMGITRLNIFAGLLGGFIIRDPTEEALNLPQSRYEIPLIIYDRILSKSGQLQYPSSGIPGKPWVPELNGSVFVINGKIFPYLEVEPRKYRFRVLNAANFRFFELSLSNRQPFHQVGTDLGLLAAPVELRSISLFPAERADLVIDFSKLSGQFVEMKHLATPILQFRVLPESVNDSAHLPVKLRTITPLGESEAVRTRTLRLMEIDDAAGNSMVMLLDGKRFHEPISEKPTIDTSEIWELVNLTGDTHPIHLHLARFRILDRRPFDRFAYNLNGTLTYRGPAVPPAASEAGWKDTVRTEPDTVTRIIVRFEGFTGRYVWHCHLLEHEDNEMMRPYEVIARQTSHAPMQGNPETDLECRSTAARSLPPSVSQRP
jgi:spore coat protein A, manganese oxidase